MLFLAEKLQKSCVFLQIIQKKSEKIMKKRNAFKAFLFWKNLIFLRGNMQDQGLPEEGFLFSYGK